MSQPCLKTKELVLVYICMTALQFWGTLFETMCRSRHVLQFWGMVETWVTILGPGLRVNRWFCEKVTQNHQTHFFKICTKLFLCLLIAAFWVKINKVFGNFLAKIITST
jgi:hypothetical protein